MANPRKFSEKIALQKQKQAEGTAEFEKIMKEVFATKRDEPLSTSQQRIGCCLSPEQQQSSGGGGNSGGGIPIPGSGGGGGGGNGNGGSGSPTAYRESRGRSVGVGPMRRPSDRKTDRSPYSNQGIYLSPPSMDNNWRRSNSDSAIHQSLILGPENPIYGTSPQQQLYLQQQQYHPNQRSHSPAASVGHSPIAQRRKPQQHMVATQHSHSSSNLQQMQMQNQLNHHKLNHQQQQQQQQHQQNHQQQQQQQVQMNHHNMHPHQQSSMVKSQLQFNACGPTNSVYKTLQEQAMAMANTGSLPDLTSVHFSNVPSPSPSAITQHNMRIEREQSQSPFSNQSYQTQQSQSQQQQQQQQLHQQQQQQHSPGGGQSHLSFTNLPVMVNQSPNNISSTLHSSYGNLPTTGGGNGGGSISPASNNVATSSSNLTEYRNPQHHNPPSPAGSASPGLMVANSPHDLHNSAPNSPIRHNQHQQQQQYSDKNIQTYDRFSPSGDYSNGSNNLNPSFHNHFAEFSLVDTAAQSEAQYIPTSLQQDLHSPHNSYSQSLQFDDTFFGHHQQFSTENGNGGSGSSKVVSGTNTNSGNSGGDPYLSLSNQNSLNNCSSSNLGPSSNSGGGGVGVGVVVGSNNNNSSSCQTGGAGTASASCSPLHSPHSPNPHSPSNNNSNLVNDISSIAQQQQQQQQQKSHHTNDGGGGGGGGMANNTSSNMHNSTTPTSTTPNIPSIVFSDFSSTDYSKEIFDTLDLDLGQMDPAGLQMLSDPSSMIADPNIEDGFRRDLN